MTMRLPLAGEKTDTVAVLAHSTITGNHTEVFMQCIIDGCEKKIAYKNDKICQMHYFRRMRTGSFELKVKARAQSRVTPNGYRVVYNPNHPLARNDGCVFEHRIVAYEKYGDNTPPCELCGKATSWKPYYSHIDHIDSDRLNNCSSNLRMLCNSCNTNRDRPASHLSVACFSVTYWGETKTPEEWGRDDRISISGNTIRNRLKRGLSVEEAFFMKKITHKNK